MNPYATQTAVGDSLMGLDGFIKYHICTTDVDQEMGITAVFDTQQRAIDHCTAAGGGQTNWQGYSCYVATVSGVKVVYRGPI